MLSKRRIKEYVDQRFEKIRQFHADFSFFSSQADLHQFRVEIKKVRTAVRVIDHCLGGKRAATLFLPLKALFKEAGEIRSIYIEIGILEKYSGKGSRLIRQKEDDLASRSTLFIEKQPEHNEIIKKVEAGLDELILDFEESDVVRYMESLISKSWKLLQNPEEKEQIHQARSLMKILLYMNVLINKRIREALSLDTAYINELQEKIGHWHDADIALDELRSHEAITKKVLKSIEDEANDLSRQVFLMTRDFPERVHAEEVAS